MNKKLFYYFIIIFLVLVIALLIFYLQTESFKCVSSPLEYGVKQIGGDLSCRCSSPLSNEVLVVNQEQMYVQKPDKLFFEK